MAAIPQTGGVRVEAQNYVAVTHYPGMRKVDASHNHGYAGCPLALCGHAI